MGSKARPGRRWVRVLYGDYAILVLADMTCRVVGGGAVRNLQLGHAVTVAAAAAVAVALALALSHPLFNASEISFLTLAAFGSHFCWLCLTS